MNLKAHSIVNSQQHVVFLLQTPPKIARSSPLAAVFQDSGLGYHLHRHQMWHGTIKHLPCLVLQLGNTCLRVPVPNEHKRPLQLRCEDPMQTCLHKNTLPSNKNTHKLVASVIKPLIRCIPSLQPVHHACVHVLHLLSKSPRIRDHLLRIQVPIVSEWLPSRQRQQWLNSMMHKERRHAQNLVPAEPQRHQTSRDTL